MQKSNKTALFKKRYLLNILNNLLYEVVSLEIYTQAKTLLKRETLWVTEKMGGFKHHN